MTAATIDYELLEAWNAGDRAAGQKLVRRHTESLHRFFASKAPDAVDDLVQATFLACAESRHRFRHSSAFRTFLLAVARNVLLKHYRKSIRHEQAMTTIERMSADELGPSPSYDAVLRQEIRLLLMGLRRISLEQQLVIELVYWEGLSLQDVAEVLEVAPGTIKSRLARARETLKQAILSGLDADRELTRSTVDELERWAAHLRQIKPG